MIVLSGSTGRIGGLVGARLARQGHPMRLLVRDPSRAPRVAGAEIRARLRLRARPDLPGGH